MKYSNEFNYMLDEICEKFKNISSHELDSILASIEAPEYECFILEAEMGCDDVNYLECNSIDMTDTSHSEEFTISYCSNNQSSCQVGYSKDVEQSDDYRYSLAA